MRGEERILGRYDAQIYGQGRGGGRGNPGYDPSDTGISGAYVGAFHDYIVKELKYTRQETYDLSRSGVNEIGTFTTGLREVGGRGECEETAPDVALDLSDAMRKNPQLRVFSANGYFDLATPFFPTEYDLSHMDLPANLGGQCAVWLLPGRPHGLFECGGIEGTQGGYGEVLRHGGQR